VAFDVKRLHALVNLALKVVVHFLRKLWPWSERFGVVRFQENYVVEGLAPMPLLQRSTLAHEPGRCTGCGVCDDVCPILNGTPGGPDRVAIDARDFAGPRAFVVAGARASHLLADVRSTLDVLASPVCQGCKACDVACPEVIPITALAVALAAQHQVVLTARAGTMPILPDEIRAGRFLPPSSASEPPAASGPSLTHTRGH
jgi:ferredoxin